jgi:hypothetical protein
MDLRVFLPSGREHVKVIDKLTDGQLGVIMKLLLGRIYTPIPGQLGPTFTHDGVTYRFVPCVQKDNNILYIHKGC